MINDFRLINKILQQFSNKQTPVIPLVSSNFRAWEGGTVFLLTVDSKADFPNILRTNP